MTSQLTLAVAATMILLPSKARAETQYWQSLSISGPVAEGWRASGDMVVRTGDDRGLYQIDQAILVGRQLAPGTILWAGWVESSNYYHGRRTISEHRLRTQVTFDRIVRIGGATIGGRFRLERRVRDEQRGVAWRIRPQLKTTIPLGGSFSLRLASEANLNLNTTVYQATPGFARTRNSIALGWKLLPQATVELGYLNQHDFVRRAPDPVANALTAGPIFAF